MRNIKTHIEKIIVLVDQGVVSGTNFILAIVLAKYLGAEQFGIYAILWMIILFVSSIHSAIIIKPMMTLAVKKNKNQQKYYFKKLFVFQILFSVTSAVISFVALFYFQEYFTLPANNKIVYLLPVVVFVFLMHDFFRKVNFTINEVRKSVFLDLVGYGFQLIFLFYFLQNLTLNKSYIGVGGGLLLSTIIGWVRFKYKHYSFVGVVSLVKEHWAFSSWLVGTALLQWFSGNFFIIAAAALLGPVMVGVIRVAQSLIGVMNVFFLALENQVPVKAAKIFKVDGVRNLMFYLKKVTIVGVLLTSTMVFIFFIGSEVILNLIYGDEYIEYAYVVKGFSIFYIVVFIGYPLRFAIRTIEKNRSIFISYLISTSFSIAFAWPIVTQFGVVGVIIGLVLTQLISQVWFTWVLRKEIRTLWK